MGGRWSSRASASPGCPLSTEAIGLATGSDLSLSTGDDVISGPSLKGRVHYSPGGPSLCSPTSAGGAGSGSESMTGTRCAAQGAERIRRLQAERKEREAPRPPRQGVCRIPGSTEALEGNDRHQAVIYTVARTPVPSPDPSRLLRSRPFL